MTISYQWLLDYLPEPLPVDELSNILTSIGLEVEAVEKAEAVKGSLAGLVIGEVLTCEQHPNADKLKLTTVNVGNDVLNIVCGAPNVAQGQKVVVATVGTTIYPAEGEPFTIKKAKIRGEASEGMICAEDEIGIGKSHEGIIVLPNDVIVGMHAKDYYKIPEPDYAIEIGLTPNRSDANSHIGVAKDVCAYLTHHRGRKYEVVLPDPKLPAKGDKKVDVKVEVHAEEACPRYMGITLADVKIAPSPEWLQRRLKAIGARPINNVVDITNYVLHEYGQPLHAFDADKITGGVVNVQFLEQDSLFVTLDEKERMLQDDDLMICNAETGMCIAGVFGGVHSGVSEQTNKVFIESAYFHPAYIRRTSLHHGLRTDAATHFEKTVDVNNLLPALKRAAALMVEICGATIASDIVDVESKELTPSSIHITYEFINRLSGKEYEPEQVRGILEALGFEIAQADDEGLIVTVPFNKADMHQPADVVEEILRIDGLDNIPIPERLNMSITKGGEQDKGLRERIANTLCGMGFMEIMTNSIVNSKYYPERNDLVHMMNSLTSELDVMRPDMLESGLEVVAYNCNRKNQDLALYEMGHIYMHRDGGYIQEPRLAMWLTGNMQQAGWQGKGTKASIYYLKGVINNLLAISGIKRLTEEYDAEGNVTWKWKKEVICTATQVSNRKLDKFDIKQDVYYAVIDWAVWLKGAMDNKVKYEEVPKYPAVQRDLAIVLDKQVTYKQVQDATAQVKSDALQHYNLFDVFESEKLGAGKKSYALNYTFQLTDRTLTDEEIEKVMQQLMNVYKTQLGAQIRE